MATISQAAFRVRHSRPIWGLHTAAFAATFLGILTVWLGFVGLDYANVSPFIQLPYSNGPAACLYETSVITVSVDAQGRIYLAHNDRAIQTETIRLAAAHYGAHLAPRQLAALGELPYLGLELRQLPAYLDLPVYQRRQILLPGIPNDTLRPQLADCVLLARRLTIQRLQTAPYIGLRMDARLPAAQVKKVMRTLEQRGLHRFYLVRVGRG